MSNVMTCQLDVSGRLLHNLGNGYRGYFIKAPWPGVESCVIDSRTGAIMGNTLALVKRQIKECNLRDAGIHKTPLRIKAQAKEVPPEQFWPWVIHMFKQGAA